MKNAKRSVSIALGNFLARHGIGMRAKLIIIFLLLEVIPLVLLTTVAITQVSVLGESLQQIAVEDSSEALNNSAIENIERMTTDTAYEVAEFLYARDDDILLLAGLEPSEDLYREFSGKKTGRIVEAGEWGLSEDGQKWVRLDPQAREEGTGGVSTNEENNDMDGFHYREPELFSYMDIPLYDEITYIDIDGNELVKVVGEGSTKTRYPFDAELKNVSRRENTYVKAETYFEKLQELEPGEIYVSDVIGAYAGSNYIGMYTPDSVAAAAEERGYDIDYDPENQAYAGMENPNGVRFEGIVRWATPVTGADGNITGYVTFALNHDHIMEFVDHITPMNERYTELPSAYEGNYAFIWDYNCRSICHPRHHSIVGYDPETGEPQVPWLESSIYDAWQQSGVDRWNEFITGWPEFDNQSREKKPAPALTQAGLVGLDGRYLNNAPQCTGWMDLTQDGGSGSFYILWSGLYKLTTAGAIPYYTGQYAPSEENGYSRRGFGFVAIGAGLEDFTRPATEMEERLGGAIDDSMSDTLMRLIISAAVLIVVVILIAALTASSFTKNITQLIKGISRFRSGERQFRFHAPIKDEFGELADSFDEMADSIVHSVANPLCITDMDWKVIYMNEPGLELRKMPLDEIVGTLYSENSVYPSHTKYCPITALEEGREADTYFVEESGRYIKGIANFLYDRQGKKIGYIIETIDVTEMVNEQKKTEEQRTLLDKIFSSSPDLIWYTDKNGEYLTVNPRFASVAGIAPEEFVGKTALQVLPTSLANRFIQYDTEAVTSKRPMYREETIPFADGREETLEAVRTPIFDADDHIVGILGFARNVTQRVEMAKELKKTQTDLEQAVITANEANRHKGEFLARMSHEIRTPMNAIIGLTSILQKNLNRFDQTDEVTGLVTNLGQIESSSKHLLGLLNDILDISKIDAGKLELSDEIADLNELVKTVAVIIDPKCKEKNITFITAFDSFHPPTFRTDPLRLSQVLINLLGNAVKFTPKGGTIEFSVRKMEQAEDRMQIRFAVKDNGIGIADDKLSAIFQAFEQANGDISKQYGGTGLGLSISKRIVEMFGGEIQVESRLGRGSEFSFVLWLEESEPDVPEETAIADIKGVFTGKRVLSVDDVKVNRFVVSTFLQEAEIEVEEASDGQEALEMFENAPLNYYDMILMDVQMPHMNGYEATAAIRSLDREDAKTIPIVALTANAFKDDVDKALSYGMDAHLSKPVEEAALIKMLLRFLNR